MKLKFVVYGGGDPSVGIFPIEATITIEDNYADSEREESIKEWKELLRDYYDLPEKFCRNFEGVWTEEEYQKMIDAENREMEGMKMLEDEKKAMEGVK